MTVWACEWHLKLWEGQFCKTEPLICEIWCYLQVFTVRIKLNPRIPNWCPRIAWWCGSLLLTLKLGLRTPKSCVRLCDSVDCRLPGSSLHGILQARILEWIATPFFRESSWPRAQTRVSCTAGRFFNIWATRGAQEMARESIITDNLEKVGNNQKFSNLVWQIITLIYNRDIPVAQRGRICLQCMRCEFDPWIGEIFWRWA